jgi:glycosyltransferase involved in cell wall biosynthesis
MGFRSTNQSSDPVTPPSARQNADPGVRNATLLRAYETEVSTVERDRGERELDEELTRRLMSRQPDGKKAQGGRRQERPRVSVVVPALNEERNLPFVLPLIGAWVHEVILVDGHSNDRTCEVARSLLPEVRVLEQPARGKGAALRAGFAAAEGDIIVMLDADGSTDPREIPLFVGALVAGADFVKGNRFAQGAGTADMSRLRKGGNALLVFAVRLLFGGRCGDLCYGYMAFWKRVLPRLDLDADGFEIETQMSVKALGTGLRVAEVPSFEFKRLHGKSNLRTVPDGWRVLKTILREWRRRGGQQRRHARDLAVERGQVPSDLHN